MYWYAVEWFNTNRKICAPDTQGCPTFLVLCPVHVSLPGCPLRAQVTTHEGIEARWPLDACPSPGYLHAGTSRLSAPDHSPIHAMCTRHSELVQVLRELEPDGRSVAKLHQAYSQAVNMLIRCVPSLPAGMFCAGSLLMVGETIHQRLWSSCTRRKFRS